MYYCPVHVGTPDLTTLASLALLCGLGRLTLRSPLCALGSWAYKIKRNGVPGRTLRSCVDSTFSFANLHSRVRSRLSFRSLISGRFPRALNVEAGSRAADGAVLIKLPHALVETLSS